MKRIPVLFLMWLACTPSKAYRLRFFVQDNQGKEVAKAWIHIDDKPLGETDASGFFITTVPFAFGAQPKITAGKEDPQAYYAPYTERLEITPQTQSEVLLTVTLYALPKMQPVPAPAVAVTPPSPVAPVVAATPLPGVARPEAGTPVVSAGGKIEPVAKVDPLSEPIVPPAESIPVQLEAVPVPHRKPEPLLVVEPHALPHFEKEKIATIQRNENKGLSHLASKKDKLEPNVQKGYRLEVHTYDSSPEKKGVSGVEVRVNGRAVGKTNSSGISTYWFPGDKEDLMQVSLHHVGSPDVHTQFVAVPDMHMEKMYPIKTAVEIGTILTYEESTKLARIQTGSPLQVGQTFSVFGLQCDAWGRRKTYGKVAEWIVESVNREGGLGKIRGQVSRAQLQPGDLVVPASLHAQSDRSTPLR
jgi:hypothetical protein